MPEQSFSFTLKAGQDPVEIAGIGLVKDAGLPLARAAERMPELQDDDGKPLAGEALVTAANEWADRVGLDVSVPLAGPSPPPAPPTAPAPPAASAGSPPSPPAPAPASPISGQPPATPAADAA